MIKLKSQKGAITLYVLIAMLFLTMFLMGIYVIQTNRHQTQLEANAEIRKKYDPSLNEIDVYNSLFSNDAVVPIYTMEQLGKIGSNETVVINEENGKRYVFGNSNRTYVLMNNLQRSVANINDWTPVGYSIPNTCKLEGNGKTITIMVNNVPYVYTQKTGFKYVTSELGYVRNNLILHYDGIRNSGLQLPHNNSAINWVDLSGNNYSATMTGFNGTEESGWHDTYLAFDGIDDVAYRYMSISGANACIEIVARHYSGSYVARSDANVRTYFGGISGGVCKGNPAVQTVVQVTNPITSYVLQWKTINGSLYYDVYIDGIRKAYNVAFSNATNGTYISLGSFTPTFNQGSKMDLYAVRIYNKDLTQDEIANNYKIDKQRFGIN